MIEALNGEIEIEEIYLLNVVTGYLNLAFGIIPDVLTEIEAKDTDVVRRGKLDSR